MHTSDGAAGRPLRDGVASLVKEDVGSSGTHLLLWHQVDAAVIVAVPQSVHWISTVSCKDKGHSNTWNWMAMMGKFSNVIKWNFKKEPALLIAENKWTERVKLNVQSIFPE